MLPAIEGAVEPLDLENLRKEIEEEVEKKWNDWLKAVGESNNITLFVPRVV